MKVGRVKNKNLRLFLMLSGVVLFSGCKWFGVDRAEPPRVADGIAMPTIPGQTTDLPKGMLAVWGDGTPMVTEKEFDARLEMIMKQKPELKDMQEAFMPMLKAQLFTGLVYTKVIDKWIKENKIDQSQEYKQMFDQFLEEVKIHVNTNFFSKEIVVEPSKADLKDYYEKNKDQIALISRGGVKAMGVKFEDEKSANEFLQKAQAKGADFAKLVEADPVLKANMQDFHLVNRQSRGIDRVLVKKISEIKDFPSVEIFKIGDKAFWVVSASGKEEAAYQPYSEVKDNIYNTVKQIKQGEATQKKLDELKTKYGVRVKEKAFMPPAPPKDAAMPLPAPAEETKKKKGKRGKKVADAQDTKPLAPATKAA